MKEVESPNEISNIVRKMNFDPFLDFDEDDVNTGKERS